MIRCKFQTCFMEGVRCKKKIQGFYTLISSKGRGAPDVSAEGEGFFLSLYLSSPKARQEYMEVTLEPDLLSPTMIGVEMIELIKLIILIPFKPNFEKGSRWYMFVRKEFTPRFNFKPLAQEGGIQGTGGLVFSCKLHTYAESWKTCKKSMQKCAIACRSVQ